jgi:hypothetical protein
MQAEREAKENVTPSLPEDTLWVRFAFVDHAGIPKAKAVHRGGFGTRAQAGVASPRECSPSTRAEPCIPSRDLAPSGNAA